MRCILTGHRPTRILGKPEEGHANRYAVICTQCGKVYQEGEVDAGFAMSPREASAAGYRDFEVRK